MSTRSTRSKKKASTMSTEPQVSFDLLTANSFINVLAQDWRVGYKLWQKLPAEIQKAITAAQNQHLPSDSGEDHNDHNSGEIRHASTTTFKKRRSKNRTKRHQVCWYECQETPKDATEVISDKETNAKSS